MKNKLKVIIKKTPLVNTVAGSILSFFKNRLLPGSREYWEKRYGEGGTSGVGSYGRLAEFKAEIVNSFVKDNKISSVIEFGCGDGNQLSLFDFPRYVGLDVSKTAVKLCMKRFNGDKRKSFFLYDSECFEDNHSLFKAELALSLDVIYHLVEDDVFELYLRHLFSSSDRFVIIYSDDTNSNQNCYIKHRQFSKWVETNLPEWKLIDKINNRYPNESWANFFIYVKER